MIPTRYFIPLRGDILRVYKNTHLILLKQKTAAEQHFPTQAATPLVLSFHYSCSYRDQTVEKYKADSHDLTTPASISHSRVALQLCPIADDHCYSPCPTIY